MLNGTSRLQGVVLPSIATVARVTSTLAYHTQLLLMSSRKRSAAARALKNDDSPKRARKRDVVKEVAAELHESSESQPVEPKSRSVKRKATQDANQALSSKNLEDNTSVVLHDHFLMKSEPDEFSLDDLIAKPESTHCWDGVRNAQARNFMRSMQVGQRCFFYHSSCKVPGIVGIVEVVKTAYPDHTAWDKSSKYYDQRSTEEKPKWFMVDVKCVRKLRRFISLEELKGYKEGELADLVLLRKSRLSVQPVTSEQWNFILSLEDKNDQADS